MSKLQPGWWATIGSITTGALTAFAGVDPLASGVGAISAALVGGRIDATNSSSKVLERILMASGFGLQATLVKKMSSDFSGSIYLSNEEILRSQKIILDTLTRAGALSEDRKDPRIPRRIKENWIYRVPESAFQGKPSTSALDLLKEKGEIIVDSQSIHLGLLAALKVIKTDFGVPLKIINSSRQGADQFENINSGNEEVDFYICADANMFLLGEDNAKCNYRYFSPCFWQPQYVVVPSGTKMRSAKRLVIPNGSSAAEQYRAFKSNFEKKISKLSKRIEEVSLSDTADTFVELSPNEIMICWDPVISNLNQSVEHNIIESELYKIGTSVYCHKRWNGIDSNSLCLRTAFLEVLVSGWNSAAKNLRHSAFRLALDMNIKEQLKVAVTPNGLGNLKGRL